MVLGLIIADVSLEIQTFQENIWTIVVVYWDKQLRIHFLFCWINYHKKQRRSQSSQLLHGLSVGLLSIQYSMRWTIWPITNSRFLPTIPVIFLSNKSPQIVPNIWYIYYHPLITFYFCIFPIIPIGGFFSIPYHFLIWPGQIKHIKDATCPLVFFIKFTINKNYMFNRSWCL